MTDAGGFIIDGQWGFVLNVRIMTVSRTEHINGHTGAYSAIREVCTSPISSL